MKKIVSAVALASLVAGAFAADFTFKSEIKYQMNALEYASGKDGTLTAFATQNGVNAGTVAKGNVEKNYGTKDTFQINAKGENVAINGKFDATAEKVTVNTANAVVTLGNANITFGRFESRFANRVTTDQNDLSLIEQNYTTDAGVWNKSGSKKNANDKGITVNTWGYDAVIGNKKLGINPNLGLNSIAGIDADNVSCVSGNKTDSVAFDYTIAESLPGKLLLKAVVKSKIATWASDSDDAEKSTRNNSAYSFEAAFTHDAFTADFVTNLDDDNVGSWGLYISPKVVDALTATLGFTYAWDETTAVKANTENAGDPSKYWAIDARARYAFTDEFAAGIYTNVTNFKEGKADAYNALDIVLNANYKINDLAKVFVEGEYASILDSDVQKYIQPTTVAAQAGVILTPAKGATITTGVRGVFGGIGADSSIKDNYGTNILIPVSFRTAL